MKGDPLTISEFCLAKTLPQDYMKEIKEYQSKGYRVLSYATKSITLEKASTLKEAMNLQRNEIEIEETFEFIGIIVMDN
jgi:magnesium-transporting ATPase (P-type)